MSIGGYKIRNKKEIHFISFAVVGWVDLFTRPLYKNIVLQSFEHCQLNKGLKLHGWCIMTNHVHFLAAATNNNLSEILRDLKKFTSYSLLKIIHENEKESRKEWMLDYFKKCGSANSRNSKYQLWQKDNAPIECYSPEFTFQKLNYLHNNPVKAEWVVKPEDYLYSSARSYILGKDKGLLNIELI